MKCPKCYSNLKQIPLSKIAKVDCVQRTKVCRECGYILETIEIDKDMYEKILFTGINALKKRRGYND
jgi:transcriptional regulator NrdR family protein